jgi:hypothetical protein
VIGIELKELEECCNTDSSQTTGGAVPVTRSGPPLSGTHLPSSVNVSVTENQLISAFTRIAVGRI